MDKDIFQYLIRVCYIILIYLLLTFSISLHKISVFKKYVWLSLVKIHPVWKNILKLHIQFMI